MAKRIKINPPQLPPRRAGAPFHLVGAAPQVSSENLPKLIERFRELRKKVNAARPQLLTRQEDREYEMLRKLLTFNERIS